ncbi:MAG: phenylacetate--CoA ligase [bacterium]|nr:phenylacetate--CoA ligase [bacterium]
MAGMEQRAAEARARLDEHVREMVQWHFDPKTGCPFWLEKAAQWDFDPRKEVGGYDDLKILGHFEDEWLRGGPVRRWFPKGLEGKGAYVFETGGSTGVPKSRINFEDFQRDYEIFGDNLSDATFPRGADWLMLGPTGPRRLRLAIEHLAQYRGGIAFHVDLDPRWVGKLVKQQRFQEMEEYKAHVIHQALTILRAHDNIHCLFTTPKLLEALCEKISLVKQGIKGIFCGGTEMNAQFNRFAREELVPGIDFVPTYGNTLMGLAAPKPFDPADNYTVTYYPPAPRAVFEIVDPDDLDRRVDYGKRGRVLLTTLTREFFMPRFAERDEGDRAAPCDAYPWDGVSNLGLLTSLQSSVAVGVY